MRGIHLYGRRAPDVHTVTDARKPMSEDIRYRQRRYLISMGVRTACLVLAFVLHGPLRFVALAAAILLPYFAVVFANGGREPDGGARFAAYTPESRKKELPGGRPEIRS